MMGSTFALCLLGVVSAITIRGGETEASAVAACSTSCSAGCVTSPCPDAEGWCYACKTTPQRRGNPVRNPVSKGTSEVLEQLKETEGLLQAARPVSSKSLRIRLRRRALSNAEHTAMDERRIALLSGSLEKTAKVTMKATSADMEEGRPREIFATIAVGTPPQDFDVVLDTGSSDTWIYGTAFCKNEATLMKDCKAKGQKCSSICDGANPPDLFDGEKSSTFMLAEGCEDASSMATKAASGAVSDAIAEQLKAALSALMGPLGGAVSVTATPSPPEAAIEANFDKKAASASASSLTMTQTKDGDADRSRHQDLGPAKLSNGFENFVSGKKTTSANEHCGQISYTLTYGGGDLSAVVGKDTFSLGDIKVKGQTFGIAYNSMGNGMGTMEGLIGIGQPNGGQLDALGPHNKAMMDNMLEQKAIDKWLVSILTPGDTSSSGALVLGDLDPTLFTGEVAYSPILRSEGTNWPIKLDKILVDGKDAGLCADSGCIAVLDSGTSAVMAPTASLVALVKKLGLGSQTDCKTAVEKGGKIGFVIGGKTFEILPSNYIKTAGGKDGDKSKCGLSLGKHDIPVSNIGVENAGEELWILGTPFLEQFYVVLDGAASPHRVGLAQAKKG